jgi:hypothetical protein
MAGPVAVLVIDGGGGGGAVVPESVTGLGFTIGVGFVLPPSPVATEVVVRSAAALEPLPHARAPMARDAQATLRRAQRIRIGWTLLQAAISPPFG